MKKIKRPLLQCAGVLCIMYPISAGVFYLAETTKFMPLQDLDAVRLSILILLAPIIIKYLVQLLATPFYYLSGRSVTNVCPAGSSATVSVLVPAWNEEVGILKTLQSVLDTAYPALEIIVINDGSTDATHELITAFVQKFEQASNTPKIKYLQLTNGGKASALNRALELATGKFIVTLDADSVMDRQAIYNLIKAFTDEQIGAVAGNVIVGNRRKPIEVMQQLEYLYGFFFKRADSVFNSVYIIGGAAAAYRASILRDLGGFDPEIITEDIEMSTRILAQGFRTRYAADAVVYTEGPSNWKALCNQRLRWKFGRILTFIKHRKLFFSRDKTHTSYLTFMLLPIAVYAELTLLLEGFLLGVFFVYSIIQNDYFPLEFMIVFISVVIALQIMFDPKRRFHRNLLLLAPVAWIIFYIMDLVEFQALYRCLKRFAKCENIEWQVWVRAGLKSSSVTEPDVVHPVE